MNLETVFEGVAPPVPDLERRRRELEELLAQSALPRQVESSPQGPWELVHGRGLLFSAPHEVPHIRDGAEKAAERDTGSLAFALARHTGGSGIATTGKQLGDPNWDGDSPYVARMRSLAVDIPVIDLHMMRPRGIELCIGLGPNPQLGQRLGRLFAEEAADAALRYSINWPFGAASPRTITSQLQRQGCPAIQLELSWDCFDAGHPAMARAWSALARAARLRPS